MTPFPDESDASFVDEPLERALVSVQRSEPRQEFNAALRARFLDVDPSAAVTRAAAARRVAAPRRARWLVPIGIAAGIALFVFGGIGERAQALHWQVLDADAGAELSVDGVWMSVEDARTKLSSGEHLLVTRDLGVRLRVADYLVLEIAPSTQVELSALETDGDAPQFRLDAKYGRVGICTGPAFPGSELLLLTPDLEAQITGTAFVADIDPESTCVCCIEGPVVIRAPKSLAAPWTVDSERMCRVFKEDRNAPKWGSANDDHSRALRALKARGGALWKQ
ncbi:MAG: hypothetical protein ACKVWV_06745 [Planctomycetota bacterium]